MKVRYPEGSVFLVPLEGTGFARGVVARSAPKGKILLGYFFGPRLLSREAVNLDGLRPEQSLLSLRFGDLGLVSGRWPMVGTLKAWNRVDWPVPDEVRRDPFGKLKPVLVRYADDDPSQVLSEETIESDGGLPTAGLAGYGFVEARLSRVLP